MRVVVWNLYASNVTKPIGDGPQRSATSGTNKKELTHSANNKTFRGNLLYIKVSLLLRRVDLVRETRMIVKDGEKAPCQDVRKQPRAATS